MKKKATTEVINRLNALTNSISLHLAKEEFSEANKLQNEFFEIENSYDLFDQLYQEGEKVGVKDVTGRILVPAIYHGFSELFSYSIKRGEPLAAQNADGKFALVAADGTGKPLTEFVYDQIRCKHYTSFYTCYQDTSEGPKMGLLNNKGQEIVPCKMDHIYEISNDIIHFEQNGKFGLITIWGLYIAPIYDEMTEDKEDQVYVRLGDQWGYLNEKGTFIPKEDEETIQNSYLLNYNPDMD